jgi:hypothetical protein
VDDIDSVLTFFQAKNDGPPFRPPEVLLDRRVNASAVKGTAERKWLPDLVTELFRQINIAKAIYPGDVRPSKIERWDEKSSLFA